MQSLHGIDLGARSLMAERARALSASAARSEVRLRVALGTTAGGCAFLATHLLLHAIKLDFRLLSALSPVPLFQMILAASLVALVVGALTAIATEEPAAWLARLPKLIGILTVAFALEVVVLP